MIKKFSRSPGQFKCVTKETRYPVSIAEFLIRNLQRQVAELVKRPRTMLKILFIRRGPQFFQISPGIKSLYHWGRKRIHLNAEKAQFGAGETISTNLLAGEATGVHLTRALAQRVQSLPFIEDSNPNFTHFDTFTPK